MRAPPTPAPGPTERPGSPALHVVAVVVAVFCAHYGALALFFSQDDFAGLARAAGLLPRLTGPWRWISHQLFWDVMHRIGGLDPVPYNIASLVVHAAGAVLLLFWLRRRVSAVAALVGAVFLAVHPALFTAVRWISAIGDPLALAFGLGALLLAERRDVWRWLALPLFCAALLSKESVATLPLVLLLAAAWPATKPDGEAPGSRPRGFSALARSARDPLTLALIAVSLAFAFYLASSDVMGSRAGGGDSAYAIGLDRHVWGNLLSYLGWAVNFALPTVRGFTDARDPSVYAWALAMLTLAFVGLAWRPLRRRGFGVAWLAFGVLLLPVLPLRSHTYHYYLEVPMLGATWALAIVFDAVSAHLGVERARAGHVRTPGGGTPFATATAWVMVLLLTVNATLLIHRYETAPLGTTGLLADPVIDRARIARQVRDGIAKARPTPGTQIALWLPDGWAYPGAASTSSIAQGVPYTRRNLSSALLDGLAVRVLFPEVTEARVVDRYERLPGDWSWALCRPDGRLRVLRSAELDSLLKRFGDPR